MNAMVPGLLATMCYLGVTAYQSSRLWHRKTIKRSGLMVVGFIAVLIHALSVYMSISTESGLYFSFYSVPSLIFCTVTIIVLVSSLTKPLDNLLVVLFPLAAIAISFSWFFPDPTRQAVAASILSHILPSILAYSLFTLATIQALILRFQARQLKTNHTTGLMRILPPMQTMESLLFEMLAAGFILLSLAIATGAWFLEDLFAQHLVHKTVLSIAAWFIFLTLLWGHYKIGWRGSKAIHWTIGGFIVLMLAYFGSKFVLEVILQRI